MDGTQIPSDLPIFLFTLRRRSRARERPTAYAGAVLARLSLTLVLVGVAIQPACIFFVGDAGALKTDRCPFTGDTTTPCGECVALKCQVEVNACCTTGSCRDNLTSLDQCAGGGDVSACETLTTTDVTDSFLTDSSGDLSALGTCVMNQCAICMTPTGNDGGFVPNPNPNPTTGVTCESTGPTSCTCTAPATPDPPLTPCPQSTLSSVICCADSTYPTAGMCTCAPYACIDDGVGDCECAANPALLSAITGTVVGSCDNSTSSAMGGVCCVTNDGYCECMAPETTCSAGTTVDVCAPSPVNPCGVEYVSVSTCSGT